MELIHPFEPPLKKPEPKTKSIKWNLGKGFHMAGDGSTYIVNNTFTNESNLDYVEQYCKAVAWVQGNPVTINIDDSDGQRSLMSAQPDDFKGELDIIIETHEQHSKKPRYLQTRVNEHTQLDNLILDRIFNSTHLTVTITLPNCNEEITLLVYTSLQSSFVSPREVQGSLREQQIRNYEKCYDIVNHAISNTSIENFNKTTGTFSYVLMNFNILAINRTRIKTLLQKTGWKHIEFKTEPQYTLLELK